MQNLDFKSWMEASFKDLPSYRPRVSMQNLDRIKDRRMMHNGPFTGFRDPPHFIRRFGGDFMSGIHRASQHIRHDVSSQEPGNTYDIGKELDFKVDTKGLSVITNVHASARIFCVTDKEGNLINKRGEVINSPEGVEYLDDKTFKRRAREFAIDYIRNNPELAEDLKERNADIESLKYIGYNDLYKKDEDGFEIVELIFSCLIKNGMFAKSNTVYTPPGDNK